MEFCTVQNGTYACTMEAGHAGEHVSRYAGRWDSRYGVFSDRYSAIRYYGDDRAFHRHSGVECKRAVTYHDCPENHLYGPTFETAH